MVFLTYKVGLFEHAVCSNMLKYHYGMLGFSKIGPLQGWMMVSIVEQPYMVFPKNSNSIARWSFLRIETEWVLVVGYACRLETHMKGV